MYNEIINNNITGEVKNFVSNITTSSEDTKENIKTPEIIESTVETISPNDDNINYKNEKINKYFYNQLDNYSKIIYNAIESNKENMKTGTYEIIDVKLEGKAAWRNYHFQRDCECIPGHAKRAFYRSIAEECGINYNFA